jgi:hypothetical protein
MDNAAVDFHWFDRRMPHVDEFLHTMRGQQLIGLVGTLGG